MLNFKLTRLNIVTIFLPLVGFLGSVVILLFFTFFPQFLFPPLNLYSQPAEKLAANITNGHFSYGQGLAFFQNHQVEPPIEPFAEFTQRLDQRVLSVYDEEVVREKWIEINLAEQKLYAWEGDKLADEFLISSGKWGRTPTGEFRIWSKLKYTLMHGGSKELNTYYYLPNVPFTQYFHNGYGFHGTYWHNNFGHPMSHGCINMYTPDAQWLFYWTSPSASEEEWITYPSSDNPGTKVIVHGEAPWD